MYGKLIEVHKPARIMAVENFQVIKAKSVNTLLVFVVHDKKMDSTASIEMRAVRGTHHIE